MLLHRLSAHSDADARAINPRAVARTGAYDHAVDAATLWETLHVARAAERLNFLRPADWPDLAVALLLEDVQATGPRNIWTVTAPIA
jgi:hypothetical protein